MVVASRAYRNHVDHPRVMEFLRKTYTETGNLENWLPPRFENNQRKMDPGIYVWEDDGMLVGLVVPEEPLVYFIQIKPDYMYLYKEMIEWIEEYCKKNWCNKNKEIKIIEHEGNIEKKRWLLERGFTCGKIFGIFRMRDVDAPIPDFKLPLGFRIRTVTSDDFVEIADCIRQIWGYDDFYSDVLEVLASASFYKPDLDLVVVDEEDKIVSLCTFRLDSPSGITELEPMGTLKEYRNIGIGRALLCEGFRRLKKYNPSLLYIGGAANTPAANRLYELTGFTQRINLYTWEKPCTSQSNKIIHK